MFNLFNIRSLMNAKKTNLFFAEHTTPQSELSTRMLEALGEFARKMHKCIITEDAMKSLPSKFEKYQTELAEKMPRAKKVSHFELRQPVDPFPGWLTADNTTLLTLSAVRGVIFSPDECLQMASNNKQVS